MIELKENQAVAIIRDGKPVGITKIAKVSQRLGKVTGYETTDKQKWKASGSNGGRLSNTHIEPATGAHGNAVRLSRITQRLAGATAEEWAKLPIDLLRAIDNAFDALPD